VKQCPVLFRTLACGLLHSTENGRESIILVNAPVKAGFVYEPPEFSGKKAVKHYGIRTGGFVKNLHDSVFSGKGAEPGYFNARLVEAAGNPGRARLRYFGETVRKHIEIHVFFVRERTAVPSFTEGDHPPFRLSAP